MNDEKREKIQNKFKKDRKEKEKLLSK